MKVLYIYDHNISKKNNEYYHPYLNEIIKRYRFFSDNITVITSNTLIKDFTQFNTQNKIDVSRILTLKNFRSPLKIINLKSEDIYNEVSTADLIITKLPSFFGILAVKYANQLNKKILVEMVGCPWDSLTNHSLKGKLLAPYMVYLTNKYVKRADYVMYVSNEFLQSRYPTDKKQIGCSDVTISDVKFNSSKYLDYNNKELVILGTSAGVDVKFKNQESIIKILPFLNDGSVRFEYHLAGGGDKSRLIKVAKKYNVEDKVKFIGLLDKKGVDDFLDKVDIYIQPSKQEGLPRALVEAMSRSCFCIATKVGGNPELLDKKYIYRVKDLDNVIEIIKGLTPEELTRVSKRNYDRSQEFTLDKLETKRIKFYSMIKEDVLSKK